MWFWLSIIALLCWSGSDLFSKIGCRDASDKYSHLKMVMAVGVVMGLHAAYEIFAGGTEISLSILLTYLPVSLLYIGSMTLGYLGLRYIELSISSPICNSSGALVAVLTLIFVGAEDYSPLGLFAVALVCVGAIGLGVVDACEDEELRAQRQEAGNYKYAKSWIALALLVAYCVLDAAGTFADKPGAGDPQPHGGGLRGQRQRGPMKLTFPGCGHFVLHLRGPHQKGPPDPQNGGPQIHRRHLRDRRPSSPTFTTPSPTGAPGHVRPPSHRAHICAALRAVEPAVPEGEAVLEALRHDNLLVIIGIVIMGVFDL
jgi:uncharacterized membrane protein